jgi:hypothetical protein
MTRYAIVPNARAAIAAVDHTMTNPDTDTLKALLEKATPGPWKIEHEKASALGPKFDGPVVYAEDCETHYVADFSQNHSCRLEGEAISTAKLAAASPALAAETISLRERVKELEEDIDRLQAIAEGLAEALLNCTPFTPEEADAKHTALFIWEAYKVEKL